MKLANAIIVLATRVKCSSFETPPSEQVGDTRPFLPTSEVFQFYVECGRLSAEKCDAAKYLRV